MFEKKVIKETENKVKSASKGKAKVKDSFSIVKMILIPFLVTIILVAGLFLVVRKLGQRDVLLKNVVMASADIREGVYITPEEVDSYFKEVKVDGSAVSENAYESLEDLKKKGFYTDIPLKSGQIMYEGSIKVSDKRLDKYKSGYETTSFSVANFDKGINGQVREGAIIDIYAVDPATDELTLFVENVYVAAAFDSSGAKIETDEGVAVSYTVYVKPYEVEDMNKAINYGEIHIYKR